VENFKTNLIQILTTKLEKIFTSNGVLEFDTSTKDDNSIVTEIDYFLSNYIRDHYKNIEDFKRFNFYSEEEYSDLLFPSIILDPIDGTREFSIGRAECAISFAAMSTAEIKNNKNYAWIYNPFTGLSLDTNQKFVLGHNYSNKNILGLVSRTEFHLGKFNNIKNSKITVSPRGSIAFKLGLLTTGAIDFVISIGGKNIWDIAAGTIMASQRGFKFYLNGIEVTLLDLPRYEGVLLWCRPNQFEELWTEFKNEKA
jgi:myo-inositol-1(or 4)-monophosphatase